MKSIFITLFIFLFSSPGFSQLKIYRPIYLTENQLPPTAVQFAWTPSLSGSSHPSGLLLDTWLIPVFSSQDHSESVGPGFLDFRKSGSVYQGFWINGYSTGNFSDHYYWISAQSVGSVAEKQQVLKSGSWSWFQVTLFGIKYSEVTSFGFGLISRISGNKPVFLPFTLYSQTFNHDWIFSAWLPSRIELEYCLTEKTRLNAAVSSSSWNFVTKTGGLSYSDFRTGLGFRQELFTWTWLNGGIYRNLNPNWTNSNSGKSVYKEKSYSSAEIGILVMPE